MFCISIDDLSKYMVQSKRLLIVNGILSIMENVYFDNNESTKVITYEHYIKISS